MIDSDGETVVRLKIRRMYCPECGRIHHELPDCVVPYKRHCAKTIEKIITGEEAPCDRRLINRILSWWAIMAAYFLGIITSLTEKHGIVFGNPPAFKQMVRAVVNTNRWSFAAEVCTRSDSVSI